MKGRSRRDLAEALTRGGRKWGYETVSGIATIRDAGKNPAKRDRRAGEKK